MANKRFHYRPGYTVAFSNVFLNQSLSFFSQSVAVSRPAGEAQRYAVDMD
jgi:hypothetical protein